eukprot:jgi/Psemu1/286201/fgenesh1_pg.124_\
MISSVTRSSRIRKNENPRRNVHSFLTLRSFRAYNNDKTPINDDGNNLVVSQPVNSTFAPFRSNSLVSSLGPASLVGGTAAIYTSLLHHPSSTLNNLSFVLMMLLAVQYAVQPRLSRKYISPKVKKQSVALVEEVVKTSLAAAVFFSKPSAEIHGALKDWTLSSSLACAGLPAVLYALQGVLQYVSYQHLDSVTFNGLTQTKTLSAAFCCWLIMGKPQSLLQMVALGILFGATLVFQGYIQIGTLGKKSDKQTIRSDDKRTDASATEQSNSEGSATVSKTTGSETTETSEPRKIDDWWWRGVTPCLGAAFLSGLAGALSQKGLQFTGIRGRDPFLYTMEVSFFSAMTLLISMLRSNALDLDWKKQRAYWNWKTLIPIFMKAFSGVLTALVHKYAGSVSKGFALMFGLVLSNMIQLRAKQEPLQSYQVIGTFMIMLSTWLHFTNPV